MIRESTKELAKRESHYYRTQEAAQAALLNNQVNYRS